MPRQIETDDMKPRRRRRAAVVAVEPERGLILRVLLHSPKDTLAGAAAFLAVVGIAANALVLQAGRHPAPMFGTATVAPVAVAAPLPRMRPVEAEAKPVEAAAATVVVAKPVVSSAAASGTPRPPVAIPASKKDPVADLIVSTRRVAAVQRALTEYGYGQLKPTGVIGTDTQAAIQKFERDRKMPLTGQLSDKLIRDLVILTGRPIE